MRFILLTLSIILTILAQGQSVYTKNFTVNDGLPSSQVYHAIQDQFGYVWFATDRGISRYNGYEFESFNVSDGLTDNSIFHFFSQENGNIWCISFNRELFYFNADNKFIEYEFNNVIADSIETGVIEELLILDGEVYLTLSSLMGYVKIDTNGKFTKTIDSKKDDYTVISEKIKNTFFTYTSPGKKATINGVSATEVIQFPFDEKIHFKSIKCNNTSFFINRNAVYVYADSLQIIEKNVEPIGIGLLDSTHFWVGYRYGGIKIYNSNGEIVEWYLKEKSVSSVLTDHEGGIWFTTLNNGVFYLKNKSILVHLKNDLHEHFVKSLTANSNGELFVGYYNGNVEKIKNNQSSLFYKSTLNQPANVQYYTSINNVLIGSDHEVFYLKNREHHTIYNGFVLSFSDNTMGQPAFGLYNGYATYTDTVKRMIINDRIEDVCFEGNRVFFATLNGIKTSNNSQLELNLNNPLFKFRVDDIDYFNGNYFAASLGAGLIVFNKHHVFNVSAANGLYSNIVTEVFIENDSTVWVCTNKGLNRVQFNSNLQYTITGVSNIDGLINNEITDVEVIGDTVWVGTRNGLCSFNKKNLNANITNEFNRFLTVDKISINNTITNLDALKNLTYQENRFEINYHAISFKYGSKLLYRYRLDGLDLDWNYTSALHIKYPSIPDGDYTFYLQVKDPNGKWELNQISFSIAIRPPFYKTWWFYLVILLAIFAMIYFFFKVKILTYNRDITREILRYALKRLKGKSTFVVFKELGKDIRINTVEILFIKAAGNYIEIHTQTENFVVRCKIGEFLDHVPDAIEFLRIHRSFIVRLDKVSKKNSKMVVVNEIEIPLGETYKKSIKNIQF